MGKRSRKHAVGKGALQLKPRDEALRERVRQLGGDHVAVLAIDVAKAENCVMLRDFYGKVLLAPRTYAQTATGLAALVRDVTQLAQRESLALVIVGVEQTGRLHEPVLRALPATWEVKLIHPLVTAHLRRGESPHLKTDGRDLDALYQAVLDGCGRPARPAAAAFAQQWQAESRARSQLVHSQSRLKQQMHDRLQAVLPGLSGALDDVWDTPLVPALVRRYPTPAAIAGRTPEQLVQAWRRVGCRATVASARHMVAWAQDAVAPGPAAPSQRTMLGEDLRVLATQNRRLAAHERRLLHFLVATPYVRLLSIPGLNHVAAGTCGAAAGPLTDYPTPRALSGRAGLYPCRYQSAATDHDTRRMAHGEPYLRHALMSMGHLLVEPHGAFWAWGEARRARGWGEKKVAAAMANRCCRIVHAMGLNGQLFQHPGATPGVPVLPKLLATAAALGCTPKTALTLAVTAAAQLPVSALAAERQALSGKAWRRVHQTRALGAPANTGAALAHHTVPALLAELLKLEQHPSVAL